MSWLFSLRVWKSMELQSPTSWTATRGCSTGGAVPTRLPEPGPPYFTLIELHPHHPVQVLPAALHAGLWILHQGLVSDLRRPLLRIHSGQLTGRIQGLPRYKPLQTQKQFWPTYLICKCSDNAIPIKSWFNDPSDTALLNLLPVLDALRFSALIIVIIKLEFSVHEITLTPVLYFSFTNYFCRFTSDVRSILNRNREAQRQWWENNISPCLAFCIFKL